MSPCARSQVYTPSNDKGKVPHHHIFRTCYTPLPNWCTTSSFHVSKFLKAQGSTIVAFTFHAMKQLKFDVWKKIIREAGLLNFHIPTKRKLG